MRRSRSRRTWDRWAGTAPMTSRVLARGGRGGGQQELLHVPAAVGRQQPVVSGVVHRQLLGQQPIDLRAERQLADEHPRARSRTSPARTTPRSASRSSIRSRCTTQDISNNGMLLTLLNGVAALGDGLGDAAAAQGDQQGERRHLRAGSVDDPAADAERWGFATTTSTPTCRRTISDRARTCRRATSTFAPVYNVPNWKNTSPRLGASYDLFGNGKTADQGQRRPLSGGAAAHQLHARRQSGRRHQHQRDAHLERCQRRFPAAGERARAAEQRQLRPQHHQHALCATTIPETRGYNWEVSTSVQHELMPRVSMNVGYFRRWYGNTRVTDNLLRHAGRLQPVLRDRADAMRGCPTAAATRSAASTTSRRRSSDRSSNLVTLAKDFGEDKEIYNGVDVTLNARLPRGVVVQGGTSTGRTMTESCFVIDSPEALRNCKVTPPFQTQVKLIGVYPLPWGGIQTSATFQSLPGPADHASRVYTNAEILPSLGRNLGCRRERHRERAADRPGHDVRRPVESARLPAVEDLPAAGEPPHPGQHGSLQHVQRQRGARAEQHLRRVMAAADEHPAGRLVKFGGQIDFCSASPVRAG